MRVFIEGNNSTGPGIFRQRLSTELAKKSLLASSLSEADVWLTTGDEGRLRLKEARARGTKLLFRADGVYFEKACILTRAINYARNRSYRWLLRNAAGVVYQSKFCQKQYETFVRNREGRIIYNGIDCSAWTRTAAAPKSEEPLRILTSHFFRPHKRLQDSIRVLAELNRHGVDAVLVVVGADRLGTFDYCRRIADDCGVSGKLQWLGKLPHQELNSIYSSCHMMLCPSWIDPCPNVVVEALACGLPIICSSTGGVPELVGDAGIILEERFELDYLNYNDFEGIPRVDAAKYAEAVATISRSWHSFHSTALLRAKELFDISTIAEQYASFCFDLIGKS